MHILQQIVYKNKHNRFVGFYSCCSSNPLVIKASLLRAKNKNSIAVIESTCNQVNQFGGYTGMKPADLRDQVYDLAGQVGIDRRQVILGGDHLGPLPWETCPEEEAMQHAEELVRQCVLAGYSKIHLDTSMRVGSDDPGQPLLTETCARRGARLCVAAEKAFKEYRAGNPDAEEPVYVLGSEVPVPGGDFSQEECPITSVEDCETTIEAYAQAFEEAGVGYVVPRIIGLVVQLGVEFYESHIDEYNRVQTADLVMSMRNSPVALEGHSTDYQTADNLRRMCEDGVAILKTGPALTFSCREALYALEMIEKEIYALEPEKLSHFQQTLDSVMSQDDAHWKGYYSGSEDKVRLSRKYSFYDRARYYMPHPRVVAAQEKLFENLSGNIIPLTLLSQYLPVQYLRVRGGEVRNEPEDILLDKIGDRIDHYLVATGNNGMPDGFDKYNPLTNA